MTCIRATRSTITARATRFSGLGSRNSTKTGTVGWTSYTFDARGRVTNIQHRDSSNASLNNTTYAYDGFDRLTTKTVDGTAKTYLYDNTDQLITDDGTGYTYDANGNRTMTGYQTGTGNRTTDDGTWTYTCDDAGQRIAFRFSHLCLAVLGVRRGGWDGGHFGRNAGYTCG